MLASTVQFSNNDQPPITPPDNLVSALGPAAEESSFPQTPNSVPDTFHPLSLCSTPKQY
jgi:hypothetical protein